jgi:hypothetical protein
MTAGRTGIARQPERARAGAGGRLGTMRSPRTPRCSAVFPWALREAGATARRARRRRRDGLGLGLRPCRKPGRRDRPQPGICPALDRDRHRRTSEQALEPAERKARHLDAVADRWLAGEAAAEPCCIPKADVIAIPSWLGSNYVPDLHPADPVVLDDRRDRGRDLEHDLAVRLEEAA